MNYFLKKRKWMAWLVLLTFLFTSFMPTNLLAGNSVAEAEVGTTVSDQIEAQKYVAPDSPAWQTDTANDPNGRVQYRKTIKAGKNENEFTINLEVKTTQALDSIPTSNDSAVILILDKSGSMATEDQYTCGLEEHEHSWKNGCYQLT